KHLEAELPQFELADDLRVKQAHDIGKDRELEARHDLVRDGGAAQNVAPLENERLEPRLCQIRATGQTVVSAANDDDVVIRRHNRPPGLDGVRSQSWGAWPIA